MNPAPLELVERLVRGAQSGEHDDTRLTPLRLPAWAWPQVPDASTDEAFRHSSGVRLEMTTDATVLELDLEARRIQVEGLDLPIYPCAVDIVVDEIVSDTRGIDEVDVALITDDRAPPTETWPAVAARAADVSLTNLAVGPVASLQRPGEAK